jgi:hypothetical protein
VRGDMVPSKRIKEFSGNQSTIMAWPHERRRPEEAVAAAEAALGAGEDEAEGEAA